MFKIARIIKASNVKGKSFSTLKKIAKDKKTHSEGTDLSTKEYNQQDALTIPAEMIQLKSLQEDYDFFLDKEDFLEVTNTLEIYTESLDLKSEDSSDFILFKKKLYKLYEIRNRSKDEHNLLSTEITEDELTHVYEAHEHYFETVATDNYTKRHRAQQKLQGGYYKKKLMSPSRLRGLTSTVLALGMYIYNPYMMAYVKWNYLLTKGFQVAPIAAVLYGLYNLSENNMVNSITRIDDGINKGKVKVTVFDSPVITKDIIADPKDIIDWGRIASLDMLALRITKGYDVQTGENFTKERIFTLETQASNNAWIDIEGMEWLLGKKLESSETDELYADLIHNRCKKIANTKLESKSVIEEVRYAIEQ